MKRLIMVLATMAALFGLYACAPADNAAGAPVDGAWKSIGDSMYVFHDDQRGVTCWLNSHGAMSCLPDFELKKQ
jgi:hypothetical protein